MPVDKKQDRQSAPKKEIGRRRTRETSTANYDIPVKNKSIDKIKKGRDQR